MPQRCSMVVAVMADDTAADDVIVRLMFLDGCLKSYFDGGGRRRLNSAHPRGRSGLSG